MQYLKNVTTSQGLVFSKPCDYDSSTKLKFTSYLHNFEISDVNVVEYNHFVKVTFSLTSAQAAYFASASEFSVFFGSAQDYVQGEVSPSSVIEYQSE